MYYKHICFDLLLIIARGRHQMVMSLRVITAVRLGLSFLSFASKSPRRLTDGAVIQDGVLLTRETNFSSETYVKF